MSKQEFIDIGNVSQGWSYGVYSSLVEYSLQSFSHRTLRSTASQVSVLERSFASAGCALAAFQIEGMLQKISLEKGGGDERRDILKLLTDPKQQIAIRELFVLRDVIAHGHIYKTTVYLKDDGFPKKTHSKKLTTHTSNDFKDVVARNRTKLMGFSVNPARIDFTDAVLALAVVNRIYKQLENRTVDMVINRFIRNDGYDSKYFGDYVMILLKELPRGHRQAVSNKLRVLSKLN